MDGGLFGKIYGEDVHKYTITNGVIEADILDYGATLQALRVPDKNGKLIDIIAGYNTVEEYNLNKKYFGATVGRVANRIAKGRFVLNGKEYELNKNEYGNTLHGGSDGFDRKMWCVNTQLIYEDEVTFTMVSDDGENGFPGMLFTTVNFKITENNSLKISYSAKSDADTIISLTNHSYFNLDGECGGEIFDTELYINGDNINVTNSELIPTGELMNVKGTAYDFTSLRKIGDFTKTTDDLLRRAKVYDVNYVLNGEGYRKVAEAKSDKSGIRMEVYTDREGLQLYTANNLNGMKGKSGVYGDCSHFCMETQSVPNSINLEKFRSPILKAGDEYNSTTEYKFIIG